MSCLFSLKRVIRPDRNFSFEESVHKAAGMLYHRQTKRLGKVPTMKNTIATARKTNISKVIAKRPAWRMASLLTTSALVAGGLVAVSVGQARAGTVGNLETPTGG